MKKLARLAATASLVLGLGAPGIVAANSGSIDTTGPDSTNTVEVNEELSHEVQNNNNVNASLNTSQSAHSGSVDATHNTTAHDAGSGEAMNESSVGGSVSIDNGGTSMSPGSSSASDFDGSIENTGPYSSNEVMYSHSSDMTMTNNNTVNFSNNVNQSATSGDVNASRNTTVGHATSGSVENSSTSEFTFDIAN